MTITGDLTFWVEYEEILFKLTVQPPRWPEIRNLFELLESKVATPDFKALCFRNIGLIFLKEGNEEAAVQALKRGLVLVENDVIKFQLLLIVNLLGCKEDWQAQHVRLTSGSAREGVHEYISSLVQSFSHLQVNGERKRERDCLHLLSRGL